MGASKPGSGGSSVIVHDIAGKLYDIRPRNRLHVYVRLLHDEGFTRSKIWARRDDQVPDTRGTVVELPDDLSEIFKYEPTGIGIGDQVVFLRYSEREGFVMHDYAWEDVQVSDLSMVEGGGFAPGTKTESMFVRREIYAVNIHDIVAVITDGSAAA